MLRVQNSFLVVFDFLLFMMFEGFRNFPVDIGGSSGIENSDVEKSALTGPPETPCCYIQSCSIFGTVGVSLDNWLETRFNGDVKASFAYDVRQQVTQLVVSFMNKTTSGAIKGVGDVVRFPTDAGNGKVIKTDTVSEAEEVLKFHFVESIP